MGVVKGLPDDECINVGKSEFGRTEAHLVSFVNDQCVS